MDCIIIKIVVDDALPDSIVLIRVLDYWFLEIGIELEDLFMKNKLEEYNKLNREIPRTCLSYLSHLGAILGMASFSCGLR
jgi:hypothetical protein